MTPKKEVNGINVEQLFDTIEAIKKRAEIAQFKFRATNKWIGGTHNRATVKDFFGGGQEDASREPMVFDLDEPPVLCGKNLGANPVEYLLVALSGCLTTSLVAHAAAKGIAIKKVESRYEEDLDLRGFLGLAPDVKVGYEQIRVYFKIEADISTEQKKNSSVWPKNTLRSSTPLQIPLRSQSNWIDNISNNNSMLSQMD
jgi:uncharacterized OsmC-like protein